MVTQANIQVLWIDYQDGLEEIGKLQNGLVIKAHLIYYQNTKYLII